MVSRRPSSRGTLGSQPSSVRARVMSGWRCFGSFWGSGWKMIFPPPPAAARTASANWRMVISRGLPMFTGSVTSDSASRTSPSTRSFT